MNQKCTCNKNRNMSKNLINWKQVSIELSGSDNAIRKNQIPKKYESKINRLLKLIELWTKWIKK